MGAPPDHDDGLTEPPGPTRSCVLTRARGDRSDLIRLVEGPDGSVWADLAARLPGRGAWIAPDRALLAAAVADGRLARALARAWRRPPPEVPADLAARVEAQLRQRLLQRLGLEHRAGHLVFGHDRLNADARSGRIRLLLHAADASADGVAKLEQAWRAGAAGSAAAPSIRLPVDRVALSAALGRDNMVHAGLTDGRAATRVRAELSRYAAYLCTGELNASGGQRVRRDEEGRE